MNHCEGNMQACRLTDPLVEPGFVRDIRTAEISPPLLGRGLDLRCGFSFDPFVFRG
jgi:hypothetical protein